MKRRGNGNGFAVGGGGGGRGRLCRSGCATLPLSLRVRDFEIRVPIYQRQVSHSSGRMFHSLNKLLIGDHKPNTIIHNEYHH